MRIGNVEKGNQIQCKPRGLKARRFSGYVPGRAVETHFKKPRFLGFLKT